MKKLFIVLLALITLNTSFAQTHPAKKAKPESAKTEAKSDVVLKKDGTPDKRYKNATPAVGPVKKDGTPDKRYKANKTK